MVIRGQHNQHSVLSPGYSTDTNARFVEDMEKKNENEDSWGKVDVDDEEEEDAKGGMERDDADDDDDDDDD